jgi:antitoxin (DNA-binding transcriptional repressor) of toxin-antitoxin stability system
MKINIHDAKAHLPRLLELVEKGEAVVIAAARIPIEVKSLP